MHVIWTVRDWTEATAALPAAPPLPSRTALVPREAVAHLLRRELIRAGLGSTLAGTRFVPELAAAAAVLREAEADFEPGEEERRPARLLHVFRAGVPLEHFSLDLLRTRPGWDEAFARTIADLEGAGLRPADVAQLAGDDLRLRDVASVWRACEESAGRSWSAHRIYAEAAQALERDPSLWPFPGAVLAVADGHSTGVRARFLRAVPGVALGLFGARPLRARYLDRLQSLFGREARDAVTAASAPRRDASERDVLAAFLFEPPPVLADPDRPRSPGPDGTVHFEEHEGLEAEIEATADWVARQVMDGIPLEDIAVLVPTADPLASMVAERLARLRWVEGTLPVHVANGLPLTGLAAGARALAVVRALRAHLAGDALAAVLPSLRTVSPDGADEARRLTHGAAMDLVWSLGTAGGTAAHPEGALEWSARAARREPALQAQLQRARDADRDPEQASVARRAVELERLLSDLRAIRPALDALVAVARGVIAAEPLSELWRALRQFFADWLLQPGEGARVHVLLDDRLQGVVADAACGRLAGDDALRLVEDVIESIRIPAGRFGEPAVYVGSIVGARHLTFRSVRVVGLSEGHFPGVPREDPVIPDALRARLSIPATDGASLTPPTGADQVLSALHALDAVVRNATERVVLSASRLDLERSQREASSVILEAAAALGRPNATTGERADVIPDSVALRRDAFVPARRAGRGLRRSAPLGEAAWLDGVADGAVGVPSGWRGGLALDLRRAVLLGLRAEPDSFDGVLGAAADLRVPGLSADRPISPSALERLLRCPHMFLLERILGFEEPAAAPALREIEQPAYGSLVHRTAEAFYRAHGEAFCRREGTIEDWLRLADQFIEEAFDGFVEEYPLVGDAVRGGQRERLRRDVVDLLQYDWAARAGRRFVAVERLFGRPDPVELRVDGRSLFVRGQIDRLDVEGRLTVVRDLKTGRAHPRFGKEAVPDATLDIQIAVYGLVTRLFARRWGVPERVGTAYVYLGRGADERSWRGDVEQTLEPAARAWLTLAADLLTHRLFPRTPRSEDCTYCAFRPVCGDDVYERAGEMLASGDSVLRRFGALKNVEIETDS